MCVHHSSQFVWNASPPSLFSFFSIFFFFFFRFNWHTSNRAREEHGEDAPFTVCPSVTSVRWTYRKCRWGTHGVEKIVTVRHLFCVFTCLPRHFGGHSIAGVCVVANNHRWRNCYLHNNDSPFQKNPNTEISISSRKRWPLTDGTHVGFVFFLGGYFTGCIISVRVLFPRCVLANHQGHQRLALSLSRRFFFSNFCLLLRRRRPTRFFPFLFFSCFLRRMFWSKIGEMRHSCHKWLESSLRSSIFIFVSF